MAEASLYPGALDSTNLYEVVARLSTTLTADIAADTTTIPLAATTGFPTKGYIVIDNETIEYISVSVGSVDATGGRGHAGTAASHLNTTQVLVAVTAAVINKLRAGMIAIQTYAGTSGGTQGGINAKYLGGSTENQLSPIYLGGSTEGQLNVGYLGGSTNTEFVNVAAAQAITGVKTLTSPLFTGTIDGWIAAGTFTYASPTTITVASGAASIYQIGDKIKLTQTTAKYFYISAVADTLLTVNGAGLYTVADAAITLPYYSHSANPLGFPIKMIPGYVKASAYLGTDMANIVNATFTKVTLDTENYDIGSDFASNKFIAPVSGYYRISGTIAYASTNVADGKRFFAILYKNNASYRSTMAHSSAATVSLVPTISFEMYLAKTDYIELYCYHTNATNTITVSGTLETSLDISLISII